MNRKVFAKHNLPANFSIWPLLITLMYIDAANASALKTGLVSFICFLHYLYIFLKFMTEVEIDYLDNYEQD